MANPFPRDRVMRDDEHFAFEEVGSERHEYVDGQVHAMAAAMREQSRIAGNIFALLQSADDGAIRKHALGGRLGRYLWCPLRQSC